MPKATKAKLNFAIQSANTKTYFKVLKTTLAKKITDVYCKVKGKTRQDLRFLFYGDPLDDYKPMSHYYEIYARECSEQGDMVIDVMDEQVGNGAAPPTYLSDSKLLLPTKLELGRHFGLEVESTEYALPLWVSDRCGKVDGDYDAATFIFKSKRPMLPPIHWMSVDGQREQAFADGRAFDRSDQHKFSIECLCPTARQPNFHIEINPLKYVDSVLGQIRRRFALPERYPIKLSAQSKPIEKDEDLVKVPGATCLLVEINFMPRFSPSQLVFSSDDVPLGSSGNEAPLLSTTSRFATIIEINDGNKNSINDNNNDDNTKITRKNVVARRFNFYGVFPDDKSKEIEMLEKLNISLDATHLQNFVDAFQEDSIPYMLLPPHPNLAPVIGVIEQKAETSFRNSKKPVQNVPRFIIHDRYDTSLAEMIERRALTKDTARRVVKCISRAIHHLHKHKIVAGCISAENILISYAKSDSDVDSADSKAMKVVLVDYGWTKTSHVLDCMISDLIDAAAAAAAADDDDENEKKNVASSHDKTNAIRKFAFQRKLIDAPEFDSERVYLEEFDVWDFGIVCLHMLDSLYGFEGVAALQSHCRNPQETKENQMQDSGWLENAVINNVISNLKKRAELDETTEALFEVVEKMLRREPSAGQLPFS